ncbi:MAG: mechanosensitive ion channel [Clostridia bacterium]|nr:mechanosensitive ion channel [Clostridia bacterium]
MEKFFNNLVDFLASATTLMAVLRFLLAVIFVIVGCKIVKRISKKIVNSRAFSHLTKTMRSFLGHVIAACLYIVVIIIGAIILGIELSGFTAIIIVLGISAGLALQGSLANIAGGVMIAGLKPFEIGNYIEGDGVSGVVTDIGVFYTTLKTDDNKKIVVPNAKLSNSTITNYSANESRRLDLTFTVSYHSDLALVKKVLYSCAKVDERVLADPSPAVYVTAHGDKGVILELRMWVRNADYASVKYSMLEQVKVNFDQFGISVPYPQLDVHMTK